MISRLDSGGLIFNYKCTAACRHCLYASSPKRDGRYMDKDILSGILDKAGELGCNSFHIGGGEPFLNFERLLENIRVMSETGTGIEYLETNASWVKDIDSASEKLTELKKAGCYTVMISVCPFHTEFVPLIKADTLIEACRKCGMQMFLWQEQFYHELKRLDPERTHSFEEMESVFGGDYLMNSARRFGLNMNGRALLTFKPYLKHYSSEEIIRQNPGPCTELRSSMHFHIDCYGNYVPPGCIGLAVNFQDLGSKSDFVKYPCIAMLLDQGIDGLYHYAVSEYGFEESEIGYVSKCDLCSEIKCCLKLKIKPVKSDELVPDDYYREIFPALMYTD